MCSNPTQVRSKPHTIERVTPEWRELIVTVRPVEKPGGRWKLRLAPVNYQFCRGDRAVWTDTQAFWTPRLSQSSRKDIQLEMVRRPEQIPS